MWFNQIKKSEYFTDLYNQNFDYVYRYILARTAGNRQLTEDIVQETFTAAWSSIDRFDNKSTPCTWLCSIAKNKLRENYRNAIYKEKFEFPDSEGLAEYADDFNLEEIVFDNETQLHVLEILKGMSPLYRYVLIMKYIDELSVKEIAKTVGRSAKAVDGLLQRAKAAFEKAYLETEGRDGNHER